MMLAPRTRRLLLGLLVIVGTVLLAWTFGLMEVAARQMSARALVRRDYESATIWAERAARWNDHDAESVFLLARLARKQGRIDDMARQLKRAETLGVDRERIRREQLLAQAQTGMLDGVLEQLPKLLMEQQGDGAEICEAFTNGLLINGRLIEAKALIQQWQQAYPTDPVPDGLLGRLSEFDLQPTEAEKHYRAALSKDPQYFLALYGLGRTLIELNQWQPAYDVFQRCLAMSVKAPAQFGMARCLVHLGREEEARTLLLDAAAVPRETLSQTFKQLGEPTEFDNLSLELGMLESKLGHRDEALRWLQRAVDYNPKHRQARYQLAMTLNAAGRSAEAKPHLDYYAEVQKTLREIDRLHGLVDHNPNDWESRYRLGVLYLEIDSAEAGVFWLRSVLAIQPNHRPTHAALADYYEQAAATQPEWKTAAEYHRRLANAEPPPVP